MNVRMTNKLRVYGGLMGGLFLLMLLLMGCTGQGDSLDAPAPTQEVDSQDPLIEDAQLYADEMGIELEEALRRLQSQEDVGELGARLEAAEGGTFAGLWIEHEPAYRVVVAFTGSDGEETLRPYVEGSPLAKQVDIRSAQVTYAELKAVQEEAIGVIQPLGLSVSAGINIQENQVELYVTDEAHFDATLEEAGASLPEHVAVIAIYEPVGETPPFEVTPEPSIFMAQLKTRSAIFMQALLIGDLVVQEGCLRVETEQESTLVIWQADYYLNNHDGTIEILDETGEVVAHVGETVYMGGGEVPFSTEFAAQLREPLPEACAKPQKVWLMGGFLPEEYIPNVSGGE